MRLKKERKEANFRAIVVFCKKVSGNSIEKVPETIFLIVARIRQTWTMTSGRIHKRKCFSSPLMLSEQTLRTYNKQNMTVFWISFHHDKIFKIFLLILTA